MPKLTSACCVAVDVESVDTVVPNPMQAPWIRSPHAGKGPCDPGAAVPDACASDPSRRQRALLRDYGVAGDLYVAAQDAVRAMIDHLVTGYALTGCVPALQHRGGPQDLGDRGRSSVHRERAAAGGCLCLCRRRAQRRTRHTRRSNASPRGLSRNRGLVGRAPARPWPRRGCCVSANRRPKRSRGLLPSRCSGAAGSREARR